MKTVESLKAEKESLLKEIRFLQQDRVYADGAAYYQITSKINRLGGQVAQVDRDLYDLTFVGPLFPYEVRTQRNMEKVKLHQQAAVNSALDKLEQLLGGNNGKTNH